MSRTEIKIFKDEEDIWDICFNETGDFVNEDSYDTDIEMSLFTDKRAESSQVENPVDRRGWLGDEFSTLENFRLGSLLWLLDQARNTIITANDAVSYVRNCSEWLNIKGYVDTIEVTQRRDLLTSSLFVTIAIRIKNDEIRSFTFDLFKLSKYAGNLNVNTCFEPSVQLPTFPPSEQIAPVGDILVGDGYIG